DVFEPVDVAVDPVGNRIYVGTTGSPANPPAVAVLNRTTRQPMTRILTRGPVRALSANADASQVFAAGDRGIDVIDGNQLAVVRKMNPGPVLFSVATETGPERTLFVGDVNPGKLRRLSYSSGTAT